jgi:hypothetical protein
VGATFDETRLELEAQRARVRGTADRLQNEVRKAMDLRAFVRRHPVETTAVAASLAFFVLGGPRRTVRFARRAVRGAGDGERAYASLPPVLRALVDETGPGFGASKTEARREMALALHAWRENPKNRKKAEKAVSLALTPPGPERAFWSVVELVAVTAAAIMTRQVIGDAITRFLGGRRTAIPPAPSVPDRAAAPSGPAETGYSGWSGRRDSVAGPAKEAARAPAESTGPGSKGT